VWHADRTAGRARVEQPTRLETCDKLLRLDLSYWRPYATLDRGLRETFLQRQGN